MSRRNVRSSAIGASCAEEAGGGTLPSPRCGEPLATHLNPATVGRSLVTHRAYTGPDGSKTLVYDARGLVQTMTVTLGSNVEHWSFDYDSMGRSAHVAYPDGHVRVQQYDDEGRLASRCYQYGSLQHCYTATYDGVGNPKTMSDPYGGSDSFRGCPGAC
jgi:prepilin-type processing-associated H-X9-DG protein